MSYFIPTRFVSYAPTNPVTIVLPIYNVEVMMGTGPSYSTSYNLATGGAYPLYGTQPVPHGMFPLIYKALLVSRPGQPSIEAQLDSLTSVQYTLGKLYSQGFTTQTTRWITAVLSEIKPTFTGQSGGTMLPVELTFDLLDPVWSGTEHGNGAYLYGGAGSAYGSGISYSEGGSLPFMVGAGTFSFTVPNAGNAIVRAIRVAFATHGGTVTSIHMSGGTYTGVWDWTYAPASGGWTVVIIDAGANSVKLDTVDDYAHFALNLSTQQIPDWIRLLPGNNDFTVTWAGTATSLELDLVYCDAWK